MEWVATGVAVIAALFAGWQAYEARKARKDAKKSASAAEDHERRSVEASERIASAIEQNNREALRKRVSDEARERAAELIEASAPWKMTSEYVESGKGWLVRLGGKDVLTNVRVTLDSPSDETLLIDEVPNVMKPGDSFNLRWYQTYDSPERIEMRIDWRRPNGKALHAIESLR